MWLRRMAAPPHGRAGGRGRAGRDWSRAVAEVHCRASHAGGNKMADKPSKGLADVVAASTALSDIDGQAGLLFYRGYDIHQLAGRRDLRGDRLPAAARSRARPRRAGRLPRARLAGGRDARQAGHAPCLPDVAASQAPMEAMRSLVSLASADDPDKNSNAPGGERAQGRPADRAAAAPGRRLSRRPRAGVSACPPNPDWGWRPTSCSRCAARRPPRARPRSWTRAWCCTPTTR